MNDRSLAAALADLDAELADRAAAETEARMSALLMNLLSATEAAREDPVLRNIVRRAAEDLEAVSPGALVRMRDGLRMLKAATVAPAEALGVVQ